MYEELDVQIAQAKAQMSRLEQLRASLAPARERLTADAHRVQRIENCMADVELEIQSLESFTLQSLLDSLLWRKEGKLNHLREELAALEPECETGEHTLLKLDAEVKAIEAEIAELGNAEETYKTLCDRKHEQILADGGEAAAPLQELSARLNAAKSERQSLRKSMQIAKSLIERLRSMGNAQGRAKNKMMYGGPLGALGNATVNAIHRQGADGSVRRAGEGLLELARSIENLNLNPDCERDAELSRLGALLGQSRGELGCGSLAASPILDTIHQAIGLVQTKLDEVEPTVAAIEAQRITVIENA